MQTGIYQHYKGGYYQVTVELPLQHRNRLRCALAVRLLM